jgi:hypothetical protein
MEGATERDSGRKPSEIERSAKPLFSAGARIGPRSKGESEEVQSSSMYSHYDDGGWEISLGAKKN